MKHLTIEQIIDYVSFQELNENNIENAAEVAAHIRECRECFDMVNALQGIYDKIMESGKTPDLEGVAKEFFKELLKEKYIEPDK